MWSGGVEWELLALEFPSRHLALKFKEIFELVHELNMEPWIFGSVTDVGESRVESSGGAEDSAHRQFGGHSGTTRDRYPQCNCAENREASQLQFVLVDVLVIIVLSSREQWRCPRLMLSTAWWPCPFAVQFMAVSQVKDMGLLSVRG